VIEDDEQQLMVRRILRNGGRRYDQMSKERLVAACLERGVSVSRLALWERRLTEHFPLFQTRRARSPTKEAGDDARACGGKARLINSTCAIVGEKPLAPQASPFQRKEPQSVATVLRGTEASVWQAKSHVCG
jgi:hypothetical protein